MGRKLARTVIMMDEKTGEYGTFLPGEELPPHLEKLVTNPAAWEPEADEFESFNSQGYRAMNLGDLVELAHDRQVDLTGASKKAEVIARLEAADAAG